MAGPHYFTHSVNPIVNGGIFAAAQRDLHIHCSPTAQQVLPIGLKILLDNIVHGAFHDAAERGDPPRCHPHTREAIRSEIMKWIKSPEECRKFILWLYGPAGAGKTAIAQSIAEACAKEGLLAASFFFSRTGIGHKDTSRFIATIAYQLSRYIPAIKEQIYIAIEEDPAIFSRVLMTQMRRLLIEPLADAARRRQLVLKHPVFMIVDGVDEGGDEQAHKEILDVLGTLSVELQSIPLIILIGSRPEYEIREAFNKEPLRHLMKSLVLDDQYNPDEDISKYFQSVFDNIHSSRAEIPSSWPSEADVSTLVKKASGQFIYAATVAKFIDSPRHSPIKRLRIVLGISSPGQDTPFASLDSLYRHILSSVANIEEVLNVLTLLVLSGESPMTPLTVYFAGEILGLDIRTALLDMHALIDVPPPHEEDKGLQTHHASIYDFLMDPTRSEEFWIDTQEGHAKLANHYLNLMGRYPEKPLFNDKIRLHSVIQSFCRHSKVSSLNPLITANLESFDLEKILEKDDYSLLPLQWGEFFLGVQRQVGDHNDIFRHLQEQFDRFLINHISQYPPTIRSYLPAVLATTKLPSDFGNTQVSIVLTHLFRGRRSSLSEAQQTRVLDGHPLKLAQATINPDNSKLISDLFSEKSRAGEYFADESSYASLAKHLIQLIYLDPNHTFNSDIYSTRPPDLCLCLDYLKQSLLNAALDQHLVALLCNYTIYYEDYSEGLRDAAISGKSYMDKYGQPYRVHIHPPRMRRCIICETCSDASPVEYIFMLPCSTRPTVRPVHHLW